MSSYNTSICSGGSIQLNILSKEIIADWWEKCLDTSANFDRNNSMIDLCGSLDATNSFIKTLGAYVNVCGLSPILKKI